MYSTPTLLTILAFLALINIVIIISLYRVNRKRKQQNEKLYCPYCGGLAVLRPAEYVYGERNLNPDNYLYVCSGYPSCDSYIGVHKKSMRPMGTLANGDLRHKRIEAHRALNRWYRLAS